MAPATPAPVKKADQLRAEAARKQKEFEDMLKQAEIEEVAEKRREEEEASRRRYEEAQREVKEREEKRKAAEAKKAKKVGEADKKKKSKRVVETDDESEGPDLPPKKKMKAEGSGAGMIEAAVPCLRYVRSFLTWSFLLTSF